MSERITPEQIREFARQSEGPYGPGPMTLFALANQMEEQDAEIARLREALALWPKIARPWTGRTITFAEWDAAIEQIEFALSFGAVQRVDDLRLRVAALDAEIVRLRKVLEWQPIETAPKGGFPGDYTGERLTTSPLWVEPPLILALVNGEPEIVYWDWYYAEGGNGYESGKSAWVGAETNVDPTHWMPLPTPPAALSGGAHE